MRLKDGEPLYVNQLVTTPDVTVTEELLSAGDPLHQILDSRASPGSWPLSSARWTSSRLEVHRRVAAGQAGHPILRSSALIATSKGVAAAVEISYLTRCGCGWSWKRPPGCRSASSSARQKADFSGARRRTAPPFWYRSLLKRGEHEEKAAAALSRSRPLSPWQGRQDSNPQPPVLETGALPIELLPYAHESIPCFRRLGQERALRSESSLSGHEAGLGLFSRCPGDDPVHQTRDTSRAVPAHICNGNAGLEHTKALVRNPLCKAGGLSFDVL